MLKHLVSVILLSAALAQAAPEYVDDQSVRTRFGVLRIDDDQVLRHDGRLVAPLVRGNYSLDVLDVYEVGNTDVVLLEDLGGAACPIKLFILTLSVRRTSVTGPFGTCSEIVHLTRHGDAIQIEMYGFAGPEAPQADQRRARRKHTFRFEDGVLTENGEPVR